MVVGIAWTIGAHTRHISSRRPFHGIFVTVDKRMVERVGAEYLSLFLNVNDGERFFTEREQQRFCLSVGSFDRSLTSLHLGIIDVGTPVVECNNIGNTLFKSLGNRLLRRRLLSYCKMNIRLHAVPNFAFNCHLLLIDLLEFPCITRQQRDKVNRDIIYRHLHI